MVRALIIDDHPLFREGLKSLVQALAPQAEVRQAATMEQAREHAGAEPDLVLLDLNLPGQRHLEALAAAKAMFESAAVVVVSGDDDPATIHACIQAGAAGFIPKDTEPGATEEALRLVLDQGVYLPAKALVQGPPVAPAPSARVPGGTTPPTARAGSLSPRQVEVLRCLLQGKPNKVIARDIGIAEGTVKAHLWAVYQTLGVQNRAQAMYRAHELGLFGRLDTLGQPAMPRKKRAW